MFRRDGGVVGRLAVDDLAVADSPTQLSLAGELRLDNRAELIRELGVPVRPAPSDAELVLAAYRRWGTDSPERLLGDFAFALWDGPRERVVCARDPFGVKPLYYHLSRRDFVVRPRP